MSVTVDLRLGDCLEIMRDLPDGCVDAVITDPPYGVDVAPWDIAPTLEFRDECLRVSRGCVVMFGSAAPRSLRPFLSLEPDRMLVWAPSFSFAKTSAHGMYYRWHPVWCWRLPNKGHEGPSVDVLRERCDGRNWWNHPCTKPLALMQSLVGLAPPGATVLDPFMGSGTTGVACVETGRNFIGIEIDPEYFAIAERRIAEAQRNYQPQLALA